MKYDDLGDISSFENQPQQKGLFTFYEEQWILSRQNQFCPLNQELTTSKANKQSKIRQLQYDTQRPLKVNHTFHESNRLPFLIAKKYQNTQKNKDCSQSIMLNPMELRQKCQPIHVSMILRAQREKEKQNRIKTIQASIFKKVPTNKTIKKQKTVGSIPIQSYPFNDQDEQETIINRLKRQIAGIRIKKGSSFRGFHKQNVAIIANSLNKDILTEIEQRKKHTDSILTKMNSSYEKYSNSKSLPRYMFPILNPGMMSLRKNVQDFNKTQSQDRLNEFCRKMRQKKWRNSQLTSNNDKFC